jgi:hypothetical protein
LSPLYAKVSNKLKKLVPKEQGLKRNLAQNITVTLLNTHGKYMSVSV